ncbi:conserved hypothetical protein [Talaromyces stipitatus ATCC 10500]|uniref:DUF7703 domain-containing protein n=1 Tax=Talaromyces stipitatus (strain ATCC 10500 / CBS 375.48 / QM 6759 / NRRL 1006) TaxID=441959 RepID=B8MLK4_TALSN|nr:uncharacterized protein TSTA_049750 [Talaromyces stipitatus ATCC 10500]EED15537.1 conserved hypothetical protein [Talaromyces stipitatus ATCC 10500]
MAGDNDADDTGALDGITGFLNTNNTWLAIFLIFFLLLSIYNALELVVMILVSFRRFRGLYFWSLVLSALFGLIPYSIGFFLKFFTRVSPWVTCTVLTVGWWVMVTGQAMQVLYMICINAVVLHLPTTILTYGSNNPDASPRFVVGYNIMEKIQLTGFSIQEAIISGLYLYETFKLLHITHRDKAQRWIQYQLIAVNVLIILMDLTLLVLEYASEYAIQICLKGAVYSVKLKLEFAVLGQLVDFIRNKSGNYRHDGHHSGGTDIQMADAGNILSSSKKRYAGRDAGLPSTRADDPHFYGKTTTMILPNEVTNSSEERLNLPSGIIMTKTEFVQRIDHKRDHSDDLE